MSASAGVELRFSQCDALHCNERRSNDHQEKRDRNGRTQVDIVLVVDPQREERTQRCAANRIDPEGFGNVDSRHGVRRHAAQSQRELQATDQLGDRGADNKECSDEAGFQENLDVSAMYGPELAAAACTRGAEAVTPDGVLPEVLQRLPSTYRNAR